MLERVVEITKALMEFGASADKAIDVAAQIARDEFYQEQDKVKDERYQLKVAAKGE